MKRDVTQRIKTQTPTNYPCSFQLALLKITRKVTNERIKTKLEEMKD